VGERPIYVDCASIDFNVERKKWGILKFKIQISYDLRQIKTYCWLYDYIYKVT
jgi:hypothetical protein